MNRVYYVDEGRRRIDLSLSRKDDGELDFDGCIVILFKDDKLVMAYHPERKGWEFPGGKIEPGESIEACGIREVYEETGCLIEKLTLLGHFIITTPSRKTTAAVFYGEAGLIQSLPDNSEMERVALFDRLPEEISFDDDIYKLTLSYIMDERIR